MRGALAPPHLAHVLLAHPELARVLLMVVVPQRGGVNHTVGAVQLGEDAAQCHLRRGQVTGGRRGVRGAVQLGEDAAQCHLSNVDGTGSGWASIPVWQSNYNNRAPFNAVTGHDLGDSVPAHPGGRLSPRVDLRYAPCRSGCRGPVAAACRAS